jgi:hypothetical protein
MPVVGTQAYDDASYVMNLVRSICNDAALSIAGNLLADDQPYVPVLLNAAYRTLQEDLTDRGVEVMAKETILENIGPAGFPTDPGIFCYVNATGYNDGLTNFDTPFLPADFVGPLRLEERTNGSEEQFLPMYPTSDGLPARVKYLRLIEWEWRNNAIWFVGATQANDVRLRYNQYLTELVLTPTPSQVLIPRSDRCLAYKVAEMFAEARGSAVAPSFAAKYTEYLSRLTQQTARRKQRAQHRRIPYSRRSLTGGGWNF